MKSQLNELSAGRLTKNDLERFCDYFCKSVMKLESEKNKNKGHWLTASVRYLHDRLREEILELGVEIDCNNKEAIKDELKDVINFCLFIWDKVEED